MKLSLSTLTKTPSYYFLAPFQTKLYNGNHKDPFFYCLRLVLERRCVNLDMKESVGLLQSYFGSQDFAH